MYKALVYKELRETGWIAGGKVGEIGGAADDAEHESPDLRLVGEQDF